MMRVIIKLCILLMVAGNDTTAAMISNGALRLAENPDQRQRLIEDPGLMANGVEEMTRSPRMRPGEGITGVAAAERTPVMIPDQAHLDPRFKLFPNLPEDEYQSILAVPILSSRPWPPTAPAGRSPAPPASRA